MKLRISEDARSFEADLTAAGVELGRQQEKEPGPYTVLTAPGQLPRVVIAWNPEVDAFSRQHLRLEPLPGGRVRVTNLSSNFPIPLAEGPSLILPGAAAELTPPFSLPLEGRTVTVRPDPAGDAGLQRLARQTLLPGSSLTLAPGLRGLPPLSGPQFDQLTVWLQTTMGVLNGAVGSASFLPRAAEALVEIVGLDSGRVLLRQDGWSVAVARRSGPGGSEDWQASDNVLEALVRERRTVWRRAAHRDARAPSLHGLETVVAAPLLDAAGEVIGALYGELREGSAPAREVGQLEALLVELLAGGVSAGLARQRQEQQAARDQALLEQFFTAPLAARLRQSPDLLRGRTEMVTVLFCDIRGSCLFSRKLGPAQTEKWISAVLGKLSECVVAEEGVLVDYIGDELLAMWGAPTPQPDQTERAARAALAMLQSLEGLNRDWRRALGEDMGLGIGLNRGPAQVGNIGSAYKFKYGPLGDTVNVASRTQGLTKYLRCPLLVTGEVRAHLGGAFAARRVCKARLINIPDPIDLFEVIAAADERAASFPASQQALDALEGRQFAPAGRQAGSLLERHSGDGPLLLILSRAADALMHNGAGFDPVWEPPGK
jgi:adenylate cyclase